METADDRTEAWAAYIVSVSGQASWVPAASKYFTVVVRVTTSGLALLPVVVVLPHGMLAIAAFWICASAVSMPPSAVITETERSRSRPVDLFSWITIMVIVIIMAAASAVRATATSSATPSSSLPRRRPVSARNNMALSPYEAGGAGLHSPLSYP